MSAFNSDPDEIDEEVGEVEGLKVVKRSLSHVNLLRSVFTEPDADEEDEEYILVAQEHEKMEDVEPDDQDLDSQRREYTKEVTMSQYKQRWMKLMMTPKGTAMEEQRRIWNQMC